MAILVVETGMIYPSISAAARATGVDPSNAGKVLRGKRKSAGGYSFANVAETATQREITKIAKSREAKLSPKQKERRQESRQKSQQRVLQERKKKAPARRTAEQRQAIQRAHAALVEANDMIRRAKRGGTGAIARKDLEALAEQMGASKQGMFRTGKKDIEQYTDLDQLLQRIETIKQQEEARKAQYDINYAQQYGLRSTEEAKRKHDALDALSRAYGKLRETASRASGRFSYKTIYGDMIRDVQDLDADQIMDLANRLDEWLDEDRQHDQDQLDQIYEQWQREIEGGGDDDDGDDDEPTYISYR